MERYEMNFQDYMEIIKRCSHTVMLTFFLIAGFGLVLALALPERYRSEASLLVHAPLSGEILQTHHTDAASQQIRSLLQKSLTDSVVLDIIHKLDLYPEPDVYRSPREWVEPFRKAMEVRLLKSELVPADTGEASEIPFALSFQHKQAVLAQQTVQALVQRLIEHHAEERAEKAGQAVLLLQTQANTLHSALHELEYRISQFRVQHDGRLPEQRADNLNTINQLRGELMEMEKSMSSSRDRAEPRNNGNGIQVSPLKQLEQEYRMASSRYLPQHPDVRRLQYQLDALKKAQGTSEPEVSNTSTELNRPDYGNRLSQIQHTMEKLEGNNAAIPVVEQEYSGLLRERDSLMADYARLREKLSDAELILSQETRPDGRTLRLIEPPDVPTRPDYSLKLKIILGGILLGLVGGVSIALLKDRLNPKVYGSSALTRVTGLTPLVVIPYLETPVERSQRLRQARDRRLSLAISVLGVLVFLLVVVRF